MLAASQDVLDWLMEGDPVIRWQTMRDLLDDPRWEKEREKVASSGWGAAFLSSQAPDGAWPESRWTGTTWTLLLLLDCGMPPRPSLATAANRPLSGLLPPGQPVDRRRLLKDMDQCHLGFWLRYGSAYLPGDDRLGGIAEALLSVQMEDGGWNCRLRAKPLTHHGSFHTTFNVLEGLREAAQAGVISQTRFREAEARAMEFMAAHHMYRSDRTGRVIDERFTKLTYPSHWHYTVLRGLDYMRSTPFIQDVRLDDPIELLVSRRKANGRWPCEGRIPGTTLFDMEKPGSESRWNTLRALRVLRARGR